MSFHEFVNPIPVVTPVGRGMALFIETDPHDHYWTVALTESRAFVTFRQKQLRINRTYTYGGIPDDQMTELIK